ncbi:ATP-binding cassette domain-containing protein [Pseudonocardia parietis]|uniref:ABC-type multidrug transport system ATPase subunit n=1 Tax=Pseudonocardia parietis TaxID=570936 RepID=A0ABS4VRB6_9PSEU|nr:ABC transporter ATP-binding protein [Pseudonocardia parietis]MBP2366311.1 ABC-type multidrug transport system ATPase subunit [Pseudonocardia parietis]
MSSVIEVAGLGFAYGDTVAVDGVDLDVRPGEVFGLLGTNGAGKTTTLELVQGFRRPQMGTVRLFGQDPVAAGPAVRRRTGVVLQQAGFLAELTVAETVRMTRALSSRTDDVDDCIARVGLGHRRDAAVDTLSGGERRRLDIATATWGGPDLICRPVCQVGRVRRCPRPSSWTPPRLPDGCGGGERVGVDASSV